MIARLTGEVVDVRVARIVVHVGGVGYLVSVPHGSDYTLGETTSIHTYLAVRENALDLYGFQILDELSMFEELIKLPKIGPKTALQILSQADLATLVRAIRTDDPTYLSKMSGIGKKSAEKIVVGLKDIFEDNDFGTESTSSNRSDTDVIEALIALGYSERDAREALQNIPADITEIKARITYALKRIQG